MKRLLATLERIATALEQLVPALTQATREMHHYTFVERNESNDDITRQDVEELINKPLRGDR